ncbi:MarC family protein [Flammeovirga kamogawensis]|uniref:UPF0056 membrane protein n=1 Tax=Flammeovirga kamogawensis TaxID=373891 RepID=A0ABX8GRH1_9BACT|nr:MarC family protein [Flammeovirga kamogawensis]MBB6462781.1 multiple antibiotic resistance protein [Flammeovirga kamogawensis]QWG05991.1 NAAT family transporter [Flammeovirga kamogawensis]TRX67819.1 MarC family protein [Flammeovirga kamogawensis]
MDFDVSFKAVASVSLILFSVIDIIGSIPIIIDLREKEGKIQSGKATIVAGIIMIIFLALGKKLLGLFGIDVSSFAIAGAIILFLLGLEMILGIVLFKSEAEEGGSGSIVPLAFPLIAGAGSMTTIISLKSEYSNFSILLGIIINLLFVYIVLKSSGWIQKKLGQGGANILRKIFGIILLAIAIKLFKTNI